MDLVDAAAELRDACEALAFPEVAYVYDPLAYAWEPHDRYLRRFGAQRGRALFIGMNPGPWGMAQTGVPFADPSWARGWMGIDGRVGKPPREHPKRPVLGFASPRRDPSGAKFYSWAQRAFGDAERFFARCFVTNLCPLLFMDEAGRNIALPQLPTAARDRLAPACDAWMRCALDALEPRLVLPMGAFVEQVVRRLAPERAIRPVRHPSPANPANNAGWDPGVEGI